MKYLLLCCFEETRWGSLPETERGRIMDEYGKLVRDLKSSGRLLAGAKLEMCASAVTVRKSDGKTVVMDGPFAETKEQLGGYHVVECRDREEAIAIAARIPALSAGGVIEVRPIEYAE